MGHVTLKSSAWVERLLWPKQRTKTNRSNPSDHFYLSHFVASVTLPETNSSHLKRWYPKRKVIFQPSIFRCYVSFREGMIHSGTLTWLHGISTIEIVAIRHLKINRWRCKLVSFHVPVRVLKKRWGKQKLDNETSPKFCDYTVFFNVWRVYNGIHPFLETQWRWMDWMAHGQQKPWGLWVFIYISLIQTGPFQMWNVTAWSVKP